MNRADFYKEFVEYWNSQCDENKDRLNQTKSKEICSAVFDYLASCIKGNDRVYIKGLGTFKKKMYKEHRIGRVTDGAEAIVPAYEKVVFEMSNSDSSEE